MALKFPISLASKRDSSYTPPFETSVYDVNDSLIESRTNAWIGGFYNRDDIYRLDIGSSCTAIGSAAFRYCDNVGKNNEELYIPDSVTTIGSYAFQRNYGWFDRKLRLSNNLATIGIFAFTSCQFGGDFVIPDSVTTIPSACFENCRFTTIQIGSGLTSIPSDCFKGNTLLTELNIPNTITSIGSNAFRGLTNCIGDCIIPDSVGGSLIGWNDSGFTGDIRIGNGVTAIGDSCFTRTQNAAGTLTIGNSVTYIGSYAFRYCYKLTGDLILPDSITNIGSWVWGRCDNLDNVYINSPASVFTSINAFLQYPANKTLYVTSTYLSQYDSAWRSAQAWSNRPIVEWTSYPDPMP